MKKKSFSIWTTLIIAVIVGAAAFFGGVKYQEAHGTTIGRGGQFAQAQGGNRNGAGRRGGFGGATIGQIVAIDAKSITLKLPDGSSKIVNTSDSTTISKTDKAAKSDLTVGLRIAAIGASNTDGSITAQNIQINPMFRNGGPGGQRPQPSQ